MTDPLREWAHPCVMSRIHRRNPRHGRPRAERIAGQWETISEKGWFESSPSRAATAAPGEPLFTDADKVWDRADLYRRALDPNTPTADLLQLSGLYPRIVRRNPVVALLTVAEPEVWGWLHEQRPPLQSTLRSTHWVRRSRHNLRTRKVVWIRLPVLPDHVRQAVFRKGGGF